MVGASDWSPDSSSFVYETKLEEGNTDIFLYTVATHQNVNLTRSKNFDADPAFAPDGKHVVYVSSRDDNADIYMMDMTGRDVRRLTDHPAFDSHPGISPDGTQLLFLSNRDGRDAQLYLKDLGDDSAPVRLTDMPGVEGNNSKCWSPDGTQIVFTAEVEGKDRVFVMNVDPFPVTAAIVDPEAALDFPRVSPDGSRILLQARMPDNSFELRIADLAGGSSQTIYRSEAGLPPTFLLAAEWSPDGSKIIFDDQVGGNTDIYSLNLNGKSRTRLTDDPMPDLSPSLSPDGSTIYFVRDFYGQPKIYQMDPDGRDQRPVHEGGGGYEMSPSVSPDGKTLWLSADRLDSRRMGLDLYELPLDASGEERLVVSRPLHEVEAVFSRDGKKIAFVANSDDNPEIYIANSDGSGAVRITRNQAIDQRPVFSMDGTALFFSSNRGGKSAIYRVELPQ